MTSVFTDKTNGKTTIKIIPTSQRASNRVREHGEVMKLVQVGMFGSEPAILVESLENTWHETKWAGWFTEGEAEITELCIEVS